MSKSKKEQIVSAGALQELEDAENLIETAKMINEPRTIDIMRTRKAFSVDKGPGGWVMIEYHIRSNQVVEVKRSEPNLKSFAINDFKKAAFHWWDKEVEL